MADVVTPMTQARSLRRLADLIERQSSALTLPGIGPPAQIEFFGPNGAHLTGYGDNPALLTAVKREIRASWDDLRAKALARLANEIAVEQAAVASSLYPSPTQEP